MTDAFEALEYLADDGFRRATFRFGEHRDGGWTVYRNGARWLELGRGYRALDTLACGVCSTDLDRRFLPFPLPQVTGHELVARDVDGRRVVVEINASPAARGVGGRCVDCAAGLARHCPSRLVLGIHDLPGGFGPRLLAPHAAIVPVPDALPTDTALLVEPFAAALRAVERIAPRAGETIAVLGPRRLGMLVIAALAGVRRRAGGSFGIVALVRRPELGGTATALGADRVVAVADGGAALGDGAFDVVVDTTGQPAGLELACRLARREVHLKSTHGRPAAGLGQPTAMVVDELSVAAFAPGRPPTAVHGLRARVAWLSTRPAPAAWRAAADVVTGAPERAAELRDRLGARPGGCVVGADVVVVDDLAALDAAVRPRPADETSLVRPTGRLEVVDPDPATPLGAALARGAAFGSSRCGEFRAALDLLAADPRLRDLGRTMITHRLPATRLPDAFRIAREPVCLKAAVYHRAASEA